MANPKPLTISLHVAYVGEGGNAGKGKYFYVCDPVIVNVTEKNTPLQFKLTPESAERFKINQLFHSDNHKQISWPEIAEDQSSMELIHENKVQALTFFSILVTDSKTSQRVNLDPQATNEPTD